ncbi:MAG: HlyD family secretion protein [Bacteroidales bacterium]|jgi:HlyD family secretion protein|nr:HlyD family secretion protein [Bacteroidales bacterium]NPV37110.1 HlyD family secretion protein [Bacteroidales bacterium]
MNHSKANEIRKSGIVPAAIGLTIVALFFIYSVWILSTPKPFEVQGEADATQVKVASKLTGRIDSIAVRKGDKVEKGQLLFIIHSPEVEAKLEQARAALEAAEAQNKKAITGAQREDIEAARNSWLKAEAAADLAEKTFRRIEKLYQDGVVPAQKRDEAETQYKVARETAQAAKALYDKAVNGTRPEDKETAKAMVHKANAAINEVEAYLTETRIYAPIAGEVSNIIAEKGEIVTAGYPVVTLADLNDAWINFNLREDLLADIRQGSTIKANIPALGNREIALTITYINPLGSFATWNATKTSGDFDLKTFEVHARPTEKIEGLRPGMSALVDWNQVRKSAKKN